MSLSLGEQYGPDVDASRDLAQNVTRSMEVFADGWGMGCPVCRQARACSFSLGMKPGADKVKKVLTSLWLGYTTNF